MTDDGRKHIDLIQAVVTRLAGNSFTIKGWAVGLIAALGGFAAKDANTAFASALLFPALVFWGLDAYYLRQERLYRALYNRVVKGDQSIPPYSMNATVCEDDVDGIVGVAFSPTIKWLHLPILAFVIILMLYSANHPH